MSCGPRLRLPSRTHDFVPGPATDTEIGALVDLAHRLGARNVVIGQGRHDASCANAARFAHQWEAGGGAVLVHVSWPEEAASWLRQARRLVTPEPDLWVLSGAPAGLAQMTRRLAWSTSWEPRRTLAFGADTVVATEGLAGADVLEGMRGAYPDGALWQIHDGRLEPLHLAEGERSIR